MAVQDKWKANQAKVAFMNAFPGLTLSWPAVQGKTVEAVAALSGRPGGAVLVFSDGSFVVAPPIAPEPWELGEGLQAARTALEPRHPQAYRDLDRLVLQDKDAQRAARLEKIIGAIKNNLEQIPELKDRLRRLVDEWK
jgi:hypothetical protein